MNSLEEIALKVVDDMFVQHSYDQGDLAEFSKVFARRLVAALGAQQKPIAILQLPDPEDDRDGPWFSLDGCLQLRALPAGTKLFAAPVLPAYRKGGGRLRRHRKMGKGFFAPRLSRTIGRLLLCVELLEFCLMNNASRFRGL